MVAEVYLAGLTNEDLAALADIVEVDQLRREQLGRQGELYRQAFLPLSQVRITPPLCGSRIFFPIVPASLVPHGF